jgi:hypothetical protein
MVKIRGHAYSITAGHYLFVVDLIYGELAVTGFYAKR